MVFSELICGLKLTHDGAVAVIGDGRLLFSTEAEKIGNRRRHAHLNDLADVERQLAAHGLTFTDIDAVSVDGWLHSGDGSTSVDVTTTGDRRTESVRLAGYAVIPEPGQRADALQRLDGTGFPLGPRRVPYASYPHATGHALSSYCTSPFASSGRSSVVLVWDGGMPATVLWFDADRGSLTSLGVVVDICGALYPIFATHFDPFRVPAAERLAYGRAGDFAQLEALLPVSGKAMAYAALDSPDERAVRIMHQAAAELTPIGITQAFMWSHRVLNAVRPLGLSDAAVLASFQDFLLEMLLAGLRDGPAGAYLADGAPLCLSGGCALNIKWNAGIRASGVAREVWVPPFPNDAGSAIGAACAEMLRRTGRTALEWSAFAGPHLEPAADLPPGWTSRACTVDELATLLHVENEPVVVLEGRAELGPRALGHRSIIAPATTEAMRDRLNDIKHREHYRPVAPICLEERAMAVFEPGTPDPYMLFEHQVRPAWRDLIPAVVHTDGSARLQTVNAGDDLLYRLITAYQEHSGLPVLCNTSANAPGSGFFPDVASAMRWGGTRYVWAAGRLFCGPARTAMVNGADLSRMLAEEAG